MTSEDKPWLERGRVFSLSYNPIFHMEAGNRCKDECLPEETNRRIVDIISDVNMAYSEHARREELQQSLYRHQQDGRKVRHADSVQLPPAQP